VSDTTGDAQCYCTPVSKKSLHKQIRKSSVKLMQMIKHSNVSSTELRNRIKQKDICFGGNEKLKIYGRLNCKSGKRMRKANRVFFSSEKEAIINNYRPCGHCMRNEYKKYKDGLV